MGNEHWVENRIDNVIQSVPTGVEKYSGKKKYFSTGSIQQSEYIEEGEFAFLEKPSRANRIAKYGDVFQARMKNTNKPLIIDSMYEGCLFSTGFLQLRPYPGTYDNRLLYYFIQSPEFLKQKDDLATGSTQEALTDTNAVNLVFPLPPQNEQNRIVEKLDAILPKAKSVKARLDKIPRILKRFRQSVLAAACSGRLTEDWSEGNPDVGDWIETSIADLADYITSGSRDWSQYYSNKGAIFIRAQNISGDVLDLTNAARVELPKKVEGKRTCVGKYDLLITITGANVTKTAIVSSPIKEAYVSQHVALLRLTDINFAPYLYLWLINPAKGRKQLEDAAYGIGKPGLNLKNIKDVLIDLPPLEEQREIVRRVEKLFKLAESLEAKYTKAMKRIDKIEQSVLAKAFRGELAPQDPNDEPAEELLKRILAEKAKLQNAKKNRNDSPPNEIAIVDGKNRIP